MSAAEDTLIDRTTDRLVAAVALGEFVQGARLPAERDLARVLGVGRTTTRAALERLVDYGVLAKHRGRNGGSFVRQEWPPHAWATVARWLESRWPHLVDAAIADTHLHASIARLAAANRTDADVALLLDRLDGFRHAATSAARQDADARLHLAIILAAHNRTLTEMLLDHERRSTVVAPAHPWGDVESRPAMEQRAASEHIALVQAIIAQRVEEAGLIAQHHVEIDLELLHAARQRARSAVKSPEKSRLSGPPTG